MFTKMRRNLALSKKKSQMIRYQFQASISIKKLVLRIKVIICFGLRVHRNQNEIFNFIDCVHFVSGSFAHPKRKYFNLPRFDDRNYFAM